MAIILRVEGEKTYQPGVTDKAERQRAEEIDQRLADGIAALEKSLRERGMVRRGKKVDAARVWYEFGTLLNQIGDDCDIFGGPDEPNYWLAVHDHVSDDFQKEWTLSKTGDPLRNHFRICGRMARYPWETVQQVGTWALWRDIFRYNRQLVEDKRVLDWVIDVLKRHSGPGHKAMRPFLEEVRRRIQNKETDVLSDDELRALLADAENKAP